MSEYIGQTRSTDYEGHIIVVVTARRWGPFGWEELWSESVIEDNLDCVKSEVEHLPRFNPNTTELRLWHKRKVVACFAYTKPYGDDNAGEWK